MNLIAELKRRNVIRMAGLYLVGAWLLTQVASTVFPAFDVPGWVLRVLIVVLVLGFIPMLIFSWVFALTPGGLKRDAEVRPEESIAPHPKGTSFGAKTAQRMDRLIIVVLICALVYFAVDKFVLAPRIEATRVEAASSVPSPQSASSSSASKSVAVLPLANLGGEAKDDYLGDGISEEVLNALSKLPGLEVIGRASSFQFRGRDVDAAKVGHALNVRSLLSGTVQRAGDDLRITVELIDTATGKQLWSERYDRTFKNLFALEDDISGAVSKALAVKLGAATGQPLVDVATTNPHAHELYLRAKQLAYLSDEVSLNESVKLFNQAIAEDPNYAAAWAGLARSYAFLSDGYRAPIDLVPAMRGAAEKAVALDPDLAEGHVFLGYVLMADVHDFPAARRESERAVVLNPGSADAHMFLGLYWLEAEHNPAAARVEVQTAQGIDPLNTWNLYTGMWVATAQGDAAGVLDLAQRIVRIDPTFFYLADPLVYAYATSGRWQDCIDRSAAAQLSNGNQPDFAAAICHAHAGNALRARDILQQLETVARNRYVDSSDIAAIHAALGDKEGAYAALDKAYSDRSPCSTFGFFPGSSRCMAIRVIGR